MVISKQLTEAIAAVDTPSKVLGFRRALSDAFALLDLPFNAINLFLIAKLSSPIVIGSE